MNGSPLLLDTHVVLWAVEKPSRLSKTATAAMRRSERVLSVATYWEVVIKARKGLFDISDPVAWWNRVVDVLDAHVLSIRPEHVAAVAGLPGLHGDPFDRIILAQAIADGFTLVTNDAMMTQYGVKTLW